MTVIKKGGIALKLRRYITLLLVLALIVLFPQHGLAIEDNTSTSSEENEINKKMIEEVMENMTIEEKVGQLFIVHVYGETPTDPDYEDINQNNNRGGKNFKEVIENYHVGGVIYFNWTDNIGTPLDAAQVNSLSNGIQEIAMDQDNAIPMFISTDQEGGIVQRVTSPATVFPGNMALGATQSTDYAGQSARVLGKELSSLGINMNFAPTLDVNMNPKNPVIGVRSFGENPTMVSQLGIAQINGYRDENVIASAKHFPGHGDTDVDSHHGLPIIDHDLETLHEIDLKPFKDAIDAGIDSIMTAHIVVPAIDDSGLPATLSKPIITDLLRDEMGYDGLVITDSLGMSGANVYPQDRVPVEAFKAGVDILLNPPNVEEAYNGVLEAVQSGEISEERLNESVFRILSAKTDKDLFENPYTDPENIEMIGTDEHLQIANDIAEKSITLVKNEDNLLPLQDESENVVIIGPGQAKPGLLSEHLNDKGFDTNAFATGTSPTEAEIGEAVEKAEDAEKVIVTTYTANTNEAQQQLVEQLQDLDKPVIIAALGNPYDLMAFPDVDAYINTYSYLDVSIPALAKVIVGDVNPSGHLPVTIPELYNEGHGLDYIDTPLSANGMKSLVMELNETGDINSDDALRLLTMHLTAVDRFEQKENAEKVMKHLKGLIQLLEHQVENNEMTAKAFSYLETETDQLIKKWSGD